MANAEILATVLGTDSTFGTVSGLAVPNPLTYARLKTYERDGVICSYVGEGTITNDPLDTFGCRAVAAIPNLQALLQHVSKNGYGHHTAMNPSHVGDIIAEAFGTYMGWQVYYHK
jgi:L-fucose isomerase-like protein